ncbi:MAG: hypothetical protein CL678_13780 [Bdellovibrionaceae bacterium]|nr:hypothetical protein [Pseudobdellovibrionaceae bacterium]|tara:strand:+ start:2053 stop:2850 length:798 start_codon:yes stop_codon:yes gene_type:complete
MGKKSTIRTMIMTLALGGMVAACAKPTTGESYEKECVLPSDQSGTLEGRWLNNPAPPISVAFRTGHFNNEEAAALVAAASTWNDFYQSVNNLQLLNTGSGGVNTTSVNAADFSCASNLSTQGGAVPIYKYAASNAEGLGDTANSWPYDSEVIALTTYCPSAASPLDTFYNAVIEINYKNFFYAGRVPDLESIFVHEFGHLIGVNHSCEGTASSGVPKCSTGLDVNYLSAVMFPAVQFSGNTGIPRRSLNSNDQGRANCLYSDLLN